MKLKNIVIILLVIFSLASIFIYIEPSITGFAVQDRLMISNAKVSADKFDQEVKVEQFDDYEIKFDNALYYFTIEPEFEQEINYIEIEFMVDSSQIRDYTKEDVNIYLFDTEWKELEEEFVKQDGKYYYYQAKSKKLGLFAVAPTRKEIPAARPLIEKNELLIFGLLPILIILLFSLIFVYGSVRLIQRINYRFYLALKKIFFGLTKFAFSFAIIVLILHLISPSRGDAGQINLIYYAVLPLIVLALISDLFLNLVLKIHRLIEYNRVYKLFRNLLGVFVFSLTIIFALLIKFTPKVSGSLEKQEIIIYGLLPLLFISGFAAAMLFLAYKMFKKIIYFRHEYE